MPVLLNPECTVCMCVLFLFVCARVRVPPPHSCRKQSSWSESVTGSIPRLPSTLSLTPPSSRLTPTCRPRVRTRRPTGPSALRLPASPSHPPRPPPQHLPWRAAAGLCLGSRRSRGSKGSRGRSMRAQIQKMALISAWLKMNRLRQIKLLQQRRVCFLNSSILLSCVFIIDYFNYFYQQTKTKILTF